MPMPYAQWRASLVPASFRGAAFKVEDNGQVGGRRGPTHEYAERDTPFSEDLGRKARRWPVTGYIIGQDYIAGRDALIAACEASGPGTLQLPTLGTMQAKCDVYESKETRERGGICTFTLTFVEQGSLDGNGTSADTQSASNSAASSLGTTSASSLDTSVQGSLNQGGDVPAQPAGNGTISA